jgi:hypothetical protein
VALENLAHAQSSLGRAATLAGLRQVRSDGRAAAWRRWAVEGARRALRPSAAGTELAQAVQRAEARRFGSAYKSAEVIRRAQEKRRSEILTEAEKREQRALDELATLRFNSRQ